VDTDRSLQARWRRGDAEAAQTIVTLHYPRMLGLLYRLSGTREQAEELTQELFARLTRHVRSVGPADNLGAWLYWAAVNLWRDQLRRAITARTRGITQSGGDDELARCQAPDNVEASLDASWHRDAVRQAVMDLEPRHREVVVLCYYQGLTYEETAAAVGIPVGTVRSRLHHAVAHLRRRFSYDGKEGPEPWLTTENVTSDRS